MIFTFPNPYRVLEEYCAYSVVYVMCVCKQYFQEVVLMLAQ